MAGQAKFTPDTAVAARVRELIAGGPTAWTPAEIAAGVAYLEHLQSLSVEDARDEVLDAYNGARQAMPDLFDTAPTAPKP